MNALDLVKVGKAFGFAVPPRVHVNLGTGNSTGQNSRRKRVKGDNEDDGEEGEGGESVGIPRRQGKQRRVETLGRRKVEKEVYRKHEVGKEWSR